MHIVICVKYKTGGNIVWKAGSYHSYLVYRCKDSIVRPADYITLTGQEMDDVMVYGFVRN